MNELELFQIWFKKQNTFTIQKRNSGTWGSISFTEVIKSYNRQRDDILLEEVILKTIEDNKDNKFCDNENLAKKILHQVRRLEKNAF